MSAGDTPSQVEEPGVENGESKPVELVVVASQELDAEALKRELKRHAGDREVRTRIVFPALTESPLRHAMGDVDDAIESADARAQAQLEKLQDSDVDVEVSVGDSDPLIALEDALRASRADEVLIVTRREEDAAWLEDDLFERARGREHPELTHLVVDERSRVKQVEHVEAGRGEPEDLEADPSSGNLPRYSVRDISGIVVAIVGTVALAAIAADCPGRVGHDFGSSTACNIELLIAGGLALINVAHVIGLMLFAAQRHHGPAAEFFSRFSLIGTPLGIVAAVIISATAS